MTHTPRSIERIVEEQVQRWNLKRAQHLTIPHPRPVIGISRQYGARGAELGQIVAAKLGFSYWNHEIVDEIARHAHVSDMLVREFDEHHRAAIQEAVRAVMAGGRLSASEYVKELVRAVHGIAAHGGAVLIGRGVQYLLDASAALRVRVVAPLEHRVAGLAERRKVDVVEARKELAEIDADRRAFIHDNFGRDIDEPSAYDLIVNTGTFTMEQAAELLVHAYQIRFPVAPAAVTG